jgi:hypothetical protein
MVNKRRPFVIGVSIAAVSVLMLTALTACGSGPKSSFIVPEGAKPDDILLEPCTVKIEASAYRADCGSLVVQENRNKIDSRLVALPITRIHSSGSNPTEPIIFLDGGPGENLNLRYKPSAGLLTDHDVILIGYRGVDGSPILDCPEVNQAMQGVGGNLLSLESRA